MIFITLGSQKFQFNRLLRAVDEMMDNGLLAEEVFAQSGHSDYVPQNYDFKDFLNHEEFDAAIGRADIVLTHGGTGAIIGAVKHGKKVVAVPRLAKYGEHVDDHQLQLLRQFQRMGIIEVCYEPDKLSEAISAAREKTYERYISNTERIIENIENYINES